MYKNIGERIEYIDFLRGIGILLMVFSHIPFTDIFVHFVHAFHMPLFFFISGYLFNEKCFTWNAFKAKSRKFLIPYFIFSACGYCLWFIELKPDSFIDAITPLTSVFWNNTDGMPIAGALWFLTALLFCDTFYRVLYEKTGGKVIHIAVILLMCIGVFETKILPFRLPWAIGSGCVGLGFYHLGVMMKKVIKKKSVFHLGQIVVLGIMGVLLAMYNGPVNMRTGVYSNYLFFILSSVSLILCLWETIKIIYEKNFRCACIERIGRYSIIWVCVNEMVINILKSIVYKIELNEVVFTILITIMTMGICWGIQEIILKTPLRRIFGI